MANPIPFIVIENGDELVLRAHLARPNPQWQEIAAGAETLVIFQSVERYVTPGWYETKRETGKVVPTWNYVVVQARGGMRVDDSPEWLRGQIDMLTSQQEAGVGSDWQVSDAPEPFIAAQMRGIVGIEMNVTSLTGKFKLSQNRNEADKRGVAAGLAGRSEESAQAMAALVRAHGKIG
ncbi:MAG: FMN-binding negative transcriptional regulator [Bosea sp. (in: a-proteobacteria)]